MIWLVVSDSPKPAPYKAQESTGYQLSSGLTASAEPPTATNKTLTRLWLLLKRSHGGCLIQEPTGKMTPLTGPARESQSGWPRLEKFTT